jgi:hypothetical protein
MGNREGHRGDGDHSLKKTSSDPISQVISQRISFPYNEIEKKLIELNDSLMPTTIEVI